MISLLLALAAHAGAPTAPYPTDEVDHAVVVDAGLEPAVLIGAGYGHHVSLGSDGPDLHLGYAVRTAMGSSVDLRVDAAGRAWARRRGFDVMLGGGLEAKVLANRVHRGGSLNLSLLAGPGYYAPRGFVAAEVGAGGTLTSLLLHTDAYEDIYPDVRNGFVGPSAPQWLGGVRAGFRAGPVLVEAHVTVRTSITFEAYPPYVVPYMGGLRLGAAF